MVKQLTNQLNQRLNNQYLTINIKYFPDLPYLCGSKKEYND